MSRSTRRGFLRKSAIFGTGLGFVTRSSHGNVTANDRISVACIGVRGRGNSVMRSFAQEADCDITHICDIRKSVRQQRGAEMKQMTGRMPQLVHDYHDLLNDPSIDAFMIATPDHWHALLTIEGCLAGKDVYVEKPASHNIVEGKMAVLAAHNRQRMVQMGTQIRSASFLREAADYVQSGALGKVIFGKAWETSRNSPVHLPPDGEPSADIDYEIWQGPALERPYNEAIVRSAWRWMFDYGTGDLGNDGVHRIDFCRYVMGLDTMPDAISCSGGKFFFEDDQQWPDTMFINYEYPGRILQYEMRLWSHPKLFGVSEGAAIYGENGWVLVTNRAWKAWDADGNLVAQGTGDNGMQAHARNFLDAVRSRKRESLNQEIYSGHVSSLMCHAGNISWRTGKKLRLDAETEMFDDKVANRYLGREHRRGYELPDVS
ncbi:MAG: Gfo/Idh/MocA family oxidoreductase [Fuerstiella sp.]|nr:Gfo/Idh/MocA family oxidoreductase [Fuerstiella sp.]